MLRRQIPWKAFTVIRAVFPKPRCSPVPTGVLVGFRPCGHFSTIGNQADAKPVSILRPLAWWKANSAAMKKLFTSYGLFAVATYLGVYVTTLSGLFALVHAGAVEGPDVEAFLNSWSLKHALWGDAPIRLSPVFGEFLMAWLLTKTTEPVRLAVTIAAIPVLVRRMPHTVLRLLRVPPDMWDPRYRLPKALQRLRRVPATVSAATATGGNANVALAQAGTLKSVALLHAARHLTRRETIVHGNRHGAALVRRLLGLDRR
jgi:hypothetical protein